MSVSDVVAHALNALLVLATGIVVGAGALPDGPAPLALAALAVCAPVVSSVRLLQQRPAPRVQTEAREPATTWEDELDVDGAYGPSEEVDAIERDLGRQQFAAPTEPDSVDGAPQRAAATEASWVDALDASQPVEPDGIDAIERDLSQRQ